MPIFSSLRTDSRFAQPNLRCQVSRDDGVVFAIDRQNWTVYAKTKTATLQFFDMRPLVMPSRSPIVHDDGTVLLAHLFPPSVDYDFCVGSVSYYGRFGLGMDRMSQTMCSTYTARLTIGFEVFQTIPVGLDLSKLSALHRGLAGFEDSERRPKIKIQPISIDFGVVKHLEFESERFVLSRYQQTIHREVVIQNEGDTPCVFRFMGSEADSELVAPSWLRIEPEVVRLLSFDRRWPILLYLGTLAP
ncbi:hypothetical protein L210DRAFT_975448 [Boletus edulis BED1]|uniref:Uncharacterized protein n=1 Tax=Boletus edulis BED1 TaxID=1328754 RepID=A0AAD4BGG3_BOLED|nr:hypothetical protein L210DRAFT_975448 [Boletus edulis BED1]